MKCRGNLCSSYLDNFFYPVCYETERRINTEADCDLLKNIQEVRDELIRKCRLFEEVFEIDVEDWGDPIDKIDRGEFK